MKFLILTQFFPPETGAAQTRLSEFSSELIKQGHEVEVMTAMPNYPTGRIFSEYKGRFYLKETYKNITVHRVWLYASQGKSILRLINYLSFMLTCIYGLFVCKKPDYIFVNSGPLLLAIPAKILSCFWRRPILLNIADLWPRSIEELKATGFKSLSKLALSLEKWAYSNAKYITAVTDGIYDCLLTEKNIEKSRLMFMPNGVNASLYFPQTDPDRQLQLRHNLGLKDKFIFIYPGNHGYAHALDNVLNAANLIQTESEKNKNLNSIHILFIGGGSDKERLLTIKERYQLKNVSFLDPVSQEELVTYLQMADIGLINIRNTPLAQETRPAKMFPIMAMQKPLLFAGFSEGSDIIKKNQGGVVVEAENPLQLKAAMLDLLTGKYDLKNMGMRNRKYVLEHLQFSSIVKNWLDDLEIKEKATLN